MRYVVANGLKTHILEDIYRQNRGFVHLSTPVFESFGNGEQFSTPMLEMWVSIAYSGGGQFSSCDLVLSFAYSGGVYTMTIVGDVLPDGTQRIGEGGNRCSGAAPSSLPYPPRPPTPPTLSRLARFGCADGSYMAESARLSRYADWESEVLEC